MPEAEADSEGGEVGNEFIYKEGVEECTFLSWWKVDFYAVFTLGFQLDRLYFFTSHIVNFNKCFAYLLW